MTISVHQPQYLPWLGFFDKIKHSDYFVFLDCVQYKHREFQNRNKIRTPENWTWLTVPIVTRGFKEQIISETAINNSFPWQRKHLNAIKTCYQGTPYFDKYFAFFEDIFTNKTWGRLVELNVFIINYLIGELQIHTEIEFESDLQTNSRGTERIIEICKKVGADTYLSGIGGKHYLNESRFRDENIKLIYREFKHPVYRQNFNRQHDFFISHMSVIDLLFNHGEKSGEIIEGKI